MRTLTNNSSHIRSLFFSSFFYQESPCVSPWKRASQSNHLIPSIQAKNMLALLVNKIIGEIRRLDGLR